MVYRIYVEKKPLCNPLEYTFRGRKKSPENLTNLVRPSGLFQYFLCSIRA